MLSDDMPSFEQLTEHQQKGEIDATSILPRCDHPLKAAQ